MINQDKPTPSVSNSAKISIGETWDTIDTTWDTEIRTWDEVSKLIDNTSRPTIEVVCLAQEDGFCLLQEDGFKLVVDFVGGIINQNKP